MSCIGVRHVAGQKSACIHLAVAAGRAAMRTVTQTSHPIGNPHRERDRERRLWRRGELQALV